MPPGVNNRLMWRAEILKNVFVGADIIRPIFQFFRAPLRADGIRPYTSPLGCYLRKEALVPPRFFIQNALVYPSYYTKYDIS